MLMKHNAICMGLCLLIVACGSDTSTNNNATKEWQAPASATSQDESEKDVLHQMPDSDQIADAYDAILEKAGADDPELMEVAVHFSRSIGGASRDDSHMSVTLVSPENKNKILYCRYDFSEKRVREPVEQTLTTGMGSTEKFIDTYDGFKASLFKESDILDFDKADAVYEEAISRSEYGADKCYVNGLQFMYFPNGLQGRVSVQSSRSTSANKSFIVDKSGQITQY